MWIPPSKPPTRLAPPSFPEHQLGTVLFLPVTCPETDVLGFASVGLSSHVTVSVLPSRSLPRRPCRLIFLRDFEWPCRHSRQTHPRLSHFYPRARHLRAHSVSRPGLPAVAPAFALQVSSLSKQLRYFPTPDTAESSQLERNPGMTLVCLLPHRPHVARHCGVPSASVSVSSYCHVVTPAS